jgi:hypothetical protein
MHRIAQFALFVAALVPATASASVLLHDNYLGHPGQPGWTLPYDGVAAHSSERNTMVTESWTGDDLIVPGGAEYIIQKFEWIGLLYTGPGAQWNFADVVIYRRNPDGAGHPITPGDLPIAQFNNLPLTSFAQRVSPQGQPEYLFGLPVYEGSVVTPDVTLPPGHYYYAVRVVGNGRGQFFLATTGGGTDFGAGQMGIFQSTFFQQPNWVNIIEVLQVPDPNNPGQLMPYATDFAYRVWGEIVPEPAGLILLAAGIPLLWRQRRW